MTEFKLSEEELNLYLADKNAVEFIEVVKKFGVAFNDASKLFKDFRKGGH